MYDDFIMWIYICYRVFVFSLSLLLRKLWGAPGFAWGGEARFFTKRLMKHLLVNVG
jgi:hypothetical protein